MNARLDQAIQAHRARCKEALWAGDKNLAWLLVSIICGFQILLRMERGQKSCAVPPPSFNQYS